MDETLRKLQQTQYEILTVIDDFCKRHQIAYSLIYGTLLGAVRHKGCIPWDDDLDIIMTRRNHDRFCAEWEADPPEGYILQNKDNSPAFTQSFTKIRKKHTTFLEKKEDGNKFHTGIFVDVFIADRAPRNALALKSFRVKCMIYQLFTREYLPPKAGKAKRIVSGLILGTIRGDARRKCREKIFRSLMRYGRVSSNPTVLISTPRSITFLYPPDFFDKVVPMIYEDREFSCISTWEKFLRMQYGDYMKFPPEEKRVWRHHPLLIDFEHDYEELRQIDPDRLP